MTKTKKLNTSSVVKTGGREREILRAAVKLFSEQGFHQTKIDDIASEANVSKGLIYLYFKDKHDVLFHALRHVLEQDAAGLTALFQSARGPMAEFRFETDPQARIAGIRVMEVKLDHGP